MTKRLGGKTKGVRGVVRETCVLEMMFGRELRE